MYANPIDKKTYHVVRTCIPLGTPIDKCGWTRLNLMISIVQHTYKDSPFTETFLEKIIQPDVTWFYSAFAAFFTMLAFLVSIIVLLVVKKLVTDPISELSRRIKSKETIFDKPKEK